jgi:hypothetical protein
MRASLICIRGNAVTRHTVWAPYIDLFLLRLNAREIPTDMKEAILSVADSSRPKPPAPWQRNYRLKDPIKQPLFEPEVKMVVEKAPHALSDLRDLGWMVVEHGGFRLRLLSPLGKRPLEQESVNNLAALGGYCSRADQTGARADP